MTLSDRERNILRYTTFSGAHCIETNEGPILSAAER